jgi:fucose permease
LSQPFIRDRFTWLAYIMLAYYAYMQATLGPLVPFLRDEVEFDYTRSGLYVGALAIGMATAGLTGGRLARRWGRSRLFWGGGAGMALGAILLVAGRTLEVTIISTFLMTLFGSYLLVMIQSMLSDRHAENRAFALTEVNVFAVIGASAAPLLVAFGEERQLSWRLALFVGIVVWLLMTIWARRRIALPQNQLEAIHKSPESVLTPPLCTRRGLRSGGVRFLNRYSAKSAKNRNLPRVFWAYALVVFFSVSVEWCMLFWASTYMETVVGLSKELAATSVALFTIAQVIGRAAGSWLTRRYTPGNLLLIAGFVIIMGFPLFWLGRAPLVNALGLFLCGLGVANLYPLTLSLTSAVGVVNPDAASGYTSMSSGLAILITPQLLGIVADRVGIQSAYGIVAPLAIAIIAVTLYANRQAGKHTQQQII